MKRVSGWTFAKRGERELIKEKAAQRYPRCHVSYHKELLTDMETYSGHNLHAQSVIYSDSALVCAFMPFVNIDYPVTF